MERWDLFFLSDGTKREDKGRKTAAFFTKNGKERTKWRGKEKQTEGKAQFFVKQNDSFWEQREKTLKIRDFERKN